MASISKFSTALLSIPNELTVAAANFNINFSLMKVEAPPEFHGLRDALSRARRHEAEEGKQHITARCLGALFKDIIPSIPQLTVAYGKRVSELSKQLNTPQPAGMFADRAGADGTSIWAAATSGQHAIAIHLLSCMLSRIWKPTEATSLWVELVELRKREILAAYNDSNSTGISSVMAAQQIISRDQLAAWDASTRSWLQSADAIKRFEQTQLMLIVNNVRMPVNTRKDPYASVIDAWASAMNTMERLICGVPQRVQNGAILLAISSWHLYPNMQVLSDRTNDIDSGDKLLARSLLTISTFGTDDDREGVFWSLPLSRLRFYSPPVVTERSIASDTSRISMEEFQIVFLGSFIAPWKKVCNDEIRCCAFIVRLRESFNKASVMTPAWFELIADAASRVLDSRGHLWAQYHKLLRLGSRRCASFIHAPFLKRPAFFGLEYFSVLVRALGNTEECIQFLRRAAELREATADAAIIRYENRHDRDGPCHYASVLPHKRGSYKRSADQTIFSSTEHRRFAIGHDVPSQISCFGVDSCGCSDPASVSCICRENNTQCTILCHPDSNMCEPVSLSLPSKCLEGDCKAKELCAGCANLTQLRGLGEQGEDSYLIHPSSLETFDQQQFRIQKPGEDTMSWYKLWLGNSSIAAVFREISSPAYDSYHQTASDFPSATIEEIEKVISSPSFHPSVIDLETCCDNWTGSGHEQTMRSLEALSFAAYIYESMNGSSVSIEVMNSPIYDRSWAVATYGPPSPRPQKMTQRRTQKRSNRMTEIDHEVGRMVSFPNECETGNEVEIAYTHDSLARSFACIAWFESGEFNLPLSQLKGVMALANGDSIYIASRLLADPSITEHDVRIRRVFGNLGRSDLSLLVPPRDPRLAEMNLSSWQQINHHDFDGKFQDCFTSSSLHLNFTDSEDTVDVGNRGLRDAQVVFLEALISIDDRGHHIGDIDVLSMFNHPAFSVLEQCTHTSEHQTTGSRWQDLIAIDCWEELLDSPQSTAIFRASGNWQARLGAAAAAIQMGKRVVVLSDKVCLYCLESPEVVASDVVIA